MLDSIRTFDRTVMSALNDWAVSSDLNTFITIFFARYAIILFGVAFLYLFFKKRIRTVVVGFGVLSFAFFIDYVISIIRYRDRPYIAHTDVVRLDTMNGLASSFPSTHSIIVFAIATAVTLYGHKRLGGALFTLAALVAIARVAAGVHYPSDIIAGSVIGCLAGIFSYRFVEYALEEHHALDGDENSRK